jgi:hypothetical protein
MDHQTVERGARFFRTAYTVVHIFGSDGPAARWKGYGEEANPRGAGGSRQESRSRAVEEATLNPGRNESHNSTLLKRLATKCSQM